MIWAGSIITTIALAIATGAIGATWGPGVAIAGFCAVFVLFGLSLIFVAVMSKNGL